MVIYSEQSVSLSTSGCLGDVSWRQTQNTDLDIAEECNLDLIRVKLGWLQGRGGRFPSPTSLLLVLPSILSTGHAGRWDSTCVPTISCTQNILIYLLSS